MKIALLSDCYPPRLGGIETQVRDLGRQLVAAGHEVAVFTATPRTPGARGYQARVEDGATVHRHTLGLPADLPVNPAAPAHFREALAGFDVAHAQMGVISPVAADLADLALDLGIPTAVTWHCVLGEGVLRAARLPGARAPLGALVGSAGRWAARGAALSGVSRMVAARVGRLVGGAPVAVLPNGIDVARWRLDPAPARPTGGRVRIATAMRLAPRKRVLPLLRMLRAVHDAHPGRLSATVYGDGPYLEFARRRLTPADREWLMLPGRVTRDQLVRAYAVSDLYLLPTRLEAFGIAGLEARTAGLPVIARTGSGVEDFIEHGTNGVLAGDDEGLVAATADLVADPHARLRIRAHNLAVPPAQAWPAVIEAVIAEYDRAIAGARTGGRTR